MALLRMPCSPKASLRGRHGLRLCLAASAASSCLLFCTLLLHLLLELLLLLKLLGGWGGLAEAGHPCLDLSKGSWELFPLMTCQKLENSYENPIRSNLHPLKYLLFCASLYFCALLAAHTPQQQLLCVVRLEQAEGHPAIACQLRGGAWMHHHPGCECVLHGVAACMRVCCMYASVSCVCVCVQLFMCFCVCLCVHVCVSLRVRLFDVCLSASGCDERSQ